MPAAREAVLLVNVRSRRGAAYAGPARALLEARGVVVVAEHRITDPGAELAELLPRVLADEPPLLVVGSGDGTVASIVDHLAHRATVLGYLPLGTTNNFGRGLGIPLRLDAAADVVAYGRAALVDLGGVDGDLFANLVSVGVSAAVAGRTPHALKARIGRVAYTVTGAHALASSRPFVAEVRSGDTCWRVETHQLNIANGRMHAGTPIASDATLTDGLLVAYALGGPSRWSVAAAAARQALTPWQPVARKGYLTGTEFTVTTDPPLPVDVDGEVSGATPIRVTLLASALRVLVPRRGGHASVRGAAPPSP